MKRPKIGERRVFMIPDGMRAYHYFLWTSSSIRENCLPIDASFFSRDACHQACFLVLRGDSEWPKAGELIVAECVGYGEGRMSGQTKWVEVLEDEEE